MTHPEDLVSCETVPVHFVDVATAQDLLAALASDGRPALRIDGGAITGKRQLLSELATALRAPYPSVDNWDALDEILRDLCWLGDDLPVLFVGNAAALWRDHYALSGVLVEIWLTATVHWRATGRPFHLVFVDAALA